MEIRDSDVCQGEWRDVIAVGATAHHYEDPVKNPPPAVLEFEGALYEKEKRVARARITLPLDVDYKDDTRWSREMLIAETRNFLHKHTPCVAPVLEVGCVPDRGDSFLVTLLPDEEIVTLKSWLQSDPPASHVSSAMVQILWTFEIMRRRCVDYQYDPLESIGIVVSQQQNETTLRLRSLDPNESPILSPMQNVRAVFQDFHLSSILTDTDETPLEGEDLACPFQPTMCCRLGLCCQPRPGRSLGFLLNDIEKHWPSAKPSNCTPQVKKCIQLLKSTLKSLLSEAAIGAVEKEARQFPTVLPGRWLPASRPGTLFAQPILDKGLEKWSVATLWKCLGELAKLASQGVTMAEQSFLDYNLFPKFDCARAMQRLQTMEQVCAGEGLGLVRQVVRRGGQIASSNLTQKIAKPLLKLYTSSAGGLDGVFNAMVLPYFWKTLRAQLPPKWREDNWLLGYQIPFKIPKSYKDVVDSLQLTYNLYTAYDDLSTLREKTLQSSKRYRVPIE